MENSMITVWVKIKVKTEYIDAFIKETMENVKKSQKEVGIVTFELLKQNEMKQDYTLIEVYKDKNAIDLHKKTFHYKKWKEAVAPMMEIARQSEKYNNIS
jgi:autoinducer 2-degrading protein